MVSMGCYTSGGAGGACVSRKQETNLDIPGYILCIVYGLLLLLSG